MSTWIRLAVLVFIALPGVLQAQGTLVSETSRSPYPGLEIIERRYTNPNNNVWVAKVSLCNDYVHVDAREAPSSLRTAGSWGGAVGAQLAVNGDFYRTGPVRVYGQAVGFGIPWPSIQTGADAAYSSEWYYQDYGWIAFGPDWVEFSHTGLVKRQGSPQFGWYPTDVDKTAEVPRGTVALVSGFPELVTEGAQVTCSSPTDSSCFRDRTDMRSRNPRAAMGLTRNRKTFFLVVVDGRTTSSVGMYGTELAALMKDLGAWQAFNIDGGGSSQMWLSGEGYLNRPSDGSARSVANLWGVFAGSGHSRGQAPGSCFVSGGCFPTRAFGAVNETFKDLPASGYAYAEANILFRANITNGCQTQPERMFCPNCPITRAQAAVLTAKAAGLDVSNPPATPTFADVPASAWYYAHVEAIAAAGITNGCGDGTNYCPDNTMNRGQGAAFVRRAAGLPRAAAGVTSRFADVPDDHTHIRNIEGLAEACVPLECSAGNFCPGERWTRGDAAVFIAWAFNLEDINACLIPPEPEPDPEPRPDVAEPPPVGEDTQPGDTRTEADSSSASDVPRVGDVPVAQPDTGVVELLDAPPPALGSPDNCACQITSPVPSHAPGVLGGVALVALMGLRRRSTTA